MRFMKHIGCMLLVATLLACGGGGGSPGATTGGTTGTPTNPTPTDPTPTDPTPVNPSTLVADFIIELDKTTIANSGSDKAVLTVTAVDANRAIVAGATVAVSLDANAIFSPTSTGGVTGADGRFTGNITIGGDKADRTINATITINGLRKVAAVLVKGSVISMTAVPAAPTPSQQVTVNFNTVDAVGTPIGNATLTLSGTAGATGTVTTDPAGTATTTFTAPATAGSYTVIATGLGVSATAGLQVAAAGPSGVPNAVGTVSSASLSPQPTSIAPNAVGATTNRSKLSAKFVTAANAGIQNMRVTFRIVPPALGSGEAISTGIATVYSDVNGIAEADYISGTRSSPTNGVKVRACYKATDFVAADDCLNPGATPAFAWVDATLTVAGAPLSISIGDNNLLEKGLGQISYVKKFLIQVNDSAGVAVADAVVSASVDITHYGKGLVWGGIYPVAYSPTIRDIHNDYLPNPAPVGYVQSLPSSYTVGYKDPTTLLYHSVWCVSEDWNRNGFLDAGEDINGDAVLQPRKADVIVSYVSGNRTDANGQLLVQATYPQTVGGWLAYTLRVTTSVAGSEGEASKSYVTDVVQGDVLNGSFLTPPYGYGSCRQPN